MYKLLPPTFVGAVKPAPRLNLTTKSSNASSPSPSVAPIIEEQGIDYSISGLRWLPEEAQIRALDKKATKFEKIKNAKCGSRMWTEVEELAQLIREGKTNWEDLELDDIEVRMKWSGLFHRRKRTPGRFMMRLKLPNGELNAQQLRFLGDCIAPYGEDGCADITTRANIQLRGIVLEDADKVIQGLLNVGLSSVMSGMDNVRNLTGSPIAGIDPHELVDSRPLCHAINAMITNSGLGNPELTNLPRKINIGVSTSRDDFAHCHINDVGLKAAFDPTSGEVGFNVELGGYFSIKRNVMSISGNTFLAYDQVVPYCKALLEVFRDFGGRNDRQKARLMWLVEAMGVEQFRDAIAERMGDTLRSEVHINYDDTFERRDILGIHAQKQDGYYWAGACIPVGRMVAQDFYDIADVAEKHGDGTVRVTVEENVVFPNIPEQNLAALQKEPSFSASPSLLGTCPEAWAMDIINKLEQELDIPKLVRIHWTGCPNSCGQAQVGDIGLMGAPAKLDGKAVEGVKIMLGGSIGENPTLATDFEKGIPCDESVLLPKLRSVLIEHFGAVPKESPVAALV